MSEILPEIYKMEMYYFLKPIIHSLFVDLDQTVPLGASGSILVALAFL